MASFCPFKEPDSRRKACSRRAVPGEVHGGVSEGGLDDQPAEPFRPLGEA